MDRRDTNFSIDMPSTDFSTVYDRLLNHYPIFRDSTTKQGNAAKHGHMAIINTANRPWSVIASDRLIQSYPALNMQEFYYSTAKRAFEKTNLEIDDKINCSEELSDLITNVTEFEPEIIYLRVSPHTRSEHLISLFHMLFNKARLFVEFYDMTCLFSPENMQHVTANDAVTYQMALDGCNIALNHADTIIMKAGGAKFDEWIKQFPVKYCTYFPLISSKTLSPPAQSPIKRRLAYAGSLSAREIVGGIGSVDGANLIAYFDAIKSNSKHSLEIINGVHSSESDDANPKFAPIIERYPLSGTDNSSIIYKRAMPINTLVNYLKGFDIGLCCAHYEKDYVESVTKCGLPNRIMAYIEAGLPVIIDDRFDYACELISKYNAGKIIEPGNFPAFLDAIDEMDLEQCRLGVSKLRDYMNSSNIKSLNSLL